MHSAPDPVSDESSHDGESGLLDQLLHSSPNISDVTTRDRRADSFSECGASYIKQAARVRVNLANRERTR
jgi:hypothetical protein